MSTVLILKNSVGQSLRIVNFIKYFGNKPDMIFNGEPKVSFGGWISDKGTLELKFTGGSGSGDYYTIQVFWPGEKGPPGTIYTEAFKSRKRCDIELVDIESEFPTTVEFFPRSFSIGTPISDGCFHNSYSSLTTTKIYPL